MVRIGINGFGRIGRLCARIITTNDTMAIHHINEPNGDNAMCAYLLNYDSVHGRWFDHAMATENGLAINDRHITVTHQSQIDQTDWSACDIVLECSGKFRTAESLAPYFAQGVKQVIVAAPIKKDALNIVLGVNHERFRAEHHRLITNASCTTNCLAPVAHVIHTTLGIKHGMITTMHCMTNTQSVVDKPSKDARRARSASTNMIPTTTGSASTIGLIIPALNGKLDGIAVRVPMLGASLTDCVFEVEQSTSVEEVNAILKAASETPQLKGILGFETELLVSSDYRSDRRSAIVDASSTMVTGGTQVKILAWYDNEMGYSHRMVELAAYVTTKWGSK